MEGMSIFSHDIYANVRTRTIVLYRGCVLLLAPERGALSEGEAAWRLPGGGLEPHESLADCARREVLEETGIRVRVGRIAFVREWVVPRYATLPEGKPGAYGFGLEVYHYATPEEPVPEPQAEFAGERPPSWIPLSEVPALPLWPKELKELCRRLQHGRAPAGCHSVVGRLESPLAAVEGDPFP
jgi:8-oxo-dGTP pyrophosphatase MutT (NUDIX family)